MIEEHGHRRLPATGFERRRVEVNLGTNVVEFAVETYDEQVTLGCPQCMELGARQERERLRDVVLAADAYPYPADPGFYLDREDVLNLLSDGD